MDDFAFCGDQQFNSKVVAGLRQRFLINTHDCGTFKYVGLDVTQNSDGIQVTQDAYIDGMCPIVIGKTRRSMRDAVLTNR